MMTFVAQHHKLILVELDKLQNMFKSLKLNAESEWLKYSIAYFEFI